MLFFRQNKQNRYGHILLNFRYRVSILFLICLLMRFCFMGRYLDSCDSVNFALGLRDYDLSLLQPHFPGYPVYIFLSRVFFKLFHHEVWALAMPGVLLGSLTVYPLYFLARLLLSEKVAVLTVVFYIINPLCWLQAERPASDAMGVFFLTLSTYYLYRVFKHCHGVKGYSLFIGSLALGLGLGVRLSYFPFIILWAGVLFYLSIQRRYLAAHAIVCGLTGFVAGICLWLFPQINLAGWYSFWHNCFSFSYGHFTDWGGSVITFGGFRRIDYLTQSVWVYGLGGWWYDFSLLRLIPSIIMIISVLYLLKRCRYDRRWWFLGVYIIPYTFWIILGQNAANPRHILPVIPMILMLIANGLCKAYEEGDRVLSLLLISVFILSMSAISLKIVIRYHDTIPAPIQLIQFIERQFNTISTRVYCREEKRFFDYYAPLWDVRNVRNAVALNIDLQSSLHRPKDILLVHTSGEFGKFRTRNTPIEIFEGNPYIDNGKEGLLLYSITP